MTPRLTLALERGLALPDSGEILVFRPRAGTDLSALPSERTRIVTGFRPDHDAFAADGWRVAVTPEGQAALALVMVPRAKPLARALVAEAAAACRNGTIVVDGQKSDGIDSLMRDVRARTEIAGNLVKGHGRIFWFDAGAEFGDWAARPRTVEGGRVTLPGVFSADGTDPGTALLASELPRRLPPRMADLGAGWGALSLAVLDREGVEELHLVEAEHDALDCARRNVTDPRARFHWADATAAPDVGPVDGVVMNPPFHTGRGGDPGLGRAFIAAAAGMLTPGGELWMVANRHLPYEAALTERFADMREFGGDARFKLIYASRPKRPARSGVRR